MHGYLKLYFVLFLNMLFIN